MYHTRFITVAGSKSDDPLAALLDHRYFVESLQTNPTLRPMQTNIRSRLVGAAGAAVIVGLLGSVLLFGLSVGKQLRAVASSIALVTLRDPPPPPPPPQPRIVQPKNARAPARASQPNRRNKATPIVAPKPIVPLPAPSPIIVAVRAGPGAAASTGASDHPGAGEGAGGAGDGTGAGGAGDGDGSGGGDTPPRQIKGRLRFSDLPRELRDQEIGGSVSVRYDVDATGRVGDCTITRSSGNAALDAATCQLIERRFRYAPARTSAGEPIAWTIEESHSWTTEHPTDTEFGR